METQEDTLIDYNNCDNKQTGCKHYGLKYIMKHKLLDELFKYKNLDVKYITLCLSNNPDLRRKFAENLALMLHLINYSCKSKLECTNLISNVAENGYFLNDQNPMNYMMLNHIVDNFELQDLFGLFRITHDEFRLQILEIIHSEHHKSYKEILLYLIFIRNNYYSDEIYNFLLDKIDEVGYSNKLSNYVCKPYYDPLNIGFGVINNKYYETVISLNHQRMNEESFDGEQFIAKRMNQPIMVIMMENLLYSKYNNYYYVTGLLQVALKHKKVIKNPGMLRTARYLIQKYETNGSRINDDKQLCKQLNIDNKYTILDGMIYGSLLVCGYFLGRKVLRLF